MAHLVIDSKLVKTKQFKDIDILYFYKAFNTFLRLRRTPPSKKIVLFASMRAL